MAMGVKRTEEDLADVLWENCKLDHATGCWEWKGLTSLCGYGKLSWQRSYRAMVGAHRISYAIFVKDPGNLHVMHSCDNRLCCNPNHLSVGTDAENKADMVKKGRQARGEGHALSKLTEAEVQEIRLRLRHQKGSHIAEAYGVTKYVVSQIKLGKTWTHVPDRSWGSEEVAEVLERRWVPEELTHPVAGVFPF